ncbi:MAG: thiamine-phosphate kinase, partial [Rhodocyclaceae bacterium]|nr:thiamine-phosphate kinase [Rhodocyclaceae bacterium]
MASEFELIARYFERPVGHTDLGVGDDCALIRVAPGHQLAISTDMLVAGTHFFADTDPAALGWKTLAVNLSDLAAMGAAPRWVVLAAALPQADEAWVAAFSAGFYELAARYGVDAIGGDTTRGPLNLCPTVFGEVPIGAALRRDAAADGDDIWVSGQPGRAALGLAHLQGRAQLAPEAAQICLEALTRPQPRVELGLALRGIAHACIDVSDGLAADLGHILERSRRGAELRYDWLPLAPLLALCGDAGLAADCLLAGGDDYELC